MTRHILSMSFEVASPIRPEKPRKFHLCFTWCLFGFFQITDFQCVTRNSSGLVFRSKRLATMRGVFVCVPAGLPCSARVQVSLVQENIGRTVLPCTSLVNLINSPPDSGRLEQKTPTRDAFWCTSETCTSRHRLHRTDSHRRDRHCTHPRCRWILFFLFGRLTFM